MAVTRARKSCCCPLGASGLLKVVITYLACHAQRAHPERDRQKGRLQLGLEPLGGSNDMIECAEAA